MSRDVVGELRGLYEAGTKGEWTLRLVDEGLSAGCWAIDIPSNKWTEMSTWYIGPQNAALTVAMHRHLPALLAIATGAMHAADRSHTNGDGTCAVPWECIEEIRQGFAALSHLATATTKEGKK